MHQTDKTLVLTTHDHAQPMTLEALIYANAEMALAQAAGTERHQIAPGDSAWDNSLRGIFSILPRQPVIAIGMQAHAALAGFQKRSLFVGDHCLESVTQSQHGIEQLIWSCANTSRIIAIGDDAWGAVQLLPVADRRHYAVPPLKLPQSQPGLDARKLRIINHQPDHGVASELATLAVAQGFTIAGDVVTEHPARGGAEIHVHVGPHAVSAKNFRLIDSWHSGAVAVQLLPSRPSTGWEDGTLMAEDEVNGFICHTPQTVLAVCTQIQQDPVLARTLIAAGRHSAAPLARAWSAIAQDLLANQ
jgi:hypothetical protein